MLRRTALTVSLPVVWLSLLPAGLIAAPAEPEGGIGRKIDEFTLQDAQSKQWTLAQLSGKKGTVVAFLGTECPLVKLYAGRLNELAAAYKGKGVHFVGVFSNSQDTKGDVAAFLKSSKISFPAVLDKGAAVADRFSALRTPEVFLLDEIGRAHV